MKAILNFIGEALVDKWLLNLHGSIDSLGNVKLHAHETEEGEENSLRVAILFL